MINLMFCAGASAPWKKNSKAARRDRTILFEYISAGYKKKLLRIPEVQKHLLCTHIN